MEKAIMISKMYDFDSLTVRKAHHQKYEESAPPQNITMASPTALIGIEIEVENILNHVNTDFYWESKEDGSLRNHGAEFTSIPLRGYQVPHALKYLSKALYARNAPDFSTRTSVHIHLNVRDMTEDQIRVFILLYSLFERHFFNFVGTKRETSVFCVPLYRSRQLNGVLDSSLIRLSNGWHKYNAINCGTILGNSDVPRFGTIEFRHMYGTMNIQLICDWINQIMLLREASHQTKLHELVQQIRVLNTTSEYAAIYRAIFKQYARMDLMTKKDFEYCVTMTKLALFGNDYNKKYNRALKESAYVVKFYAKQQKPKKPGNFDANADILENYNDLVNEVQAYAANNNPKIVPLPPIPDQMVTKKIKKFTWATANTGGI